MVVMAIIPFGLVGTIYGHLQWDVPLSMFSVVGLLGMTGIIINDSIVLVTTIDDYATDRGLIPSIIDGAADRLRPVMLTTLTTVLGLMPLLFERSQQAQFIKPTVITLVYGLGFGMVMVLLVVPALLAMQRDVSRKFAALRSGLRFRARPVQMALMLGVALVLIWLVATMGLTMTAGVVPAVFVTLWPGLTAYSPMLAALMLFLAGSGMLVLILYAVMALAHRAGRGQPAGQP